MCVCVCVCVDWIRLAQDRDRWRAVVSAKSVYCLATDWTTGRSGFDPQQEQRIFPLTSVSRPALRPTQPPVQWVLAVLFLGQSAAGA
jgi:hypothetical protein